MRPSKTLKNKTLLDTYWRVQLICMKVQTHSSSTTTWIQSGPDAFDESRFVMTFLTISGVTEIFCSFRLVLDEKTSKDVSDSSRLDFSEKFIANNFSLIDAESNTFGPLNRGNIANLRFLRSLLVSWTWWTLLFQ